MSLAAAKSADAPIVLPELLSLLPSAVAAAEQYAGEARAVVAGRVSKGGKVDRVLIDDHQHAVHGFAWIATYVEVLRQLEAWAQRLNADGKFGEAEQIITQFVFGEYLAQLVGGVAMNQGEVARPNDFGLTEYAFGTLAKNKAVAKKSVKLKNNANAWLCKQFLSENTNAVFGRSICLFKNCVRV